VVNTEIRTEIRAKVWAVGDPEPEAWQADCYDDNDITRLSAGTIGVWSMGPGSKYWDDLTVNLLGPPPSQYILEVTTVDQGSVSLTPSGGTYNEGTEVELTATADPGWEFSGWSGHLTGSANPATLTMDADKSVTAIFIESDYAYQQDFGGYEDGANPAGWLDTGAGNSMEEDESLFKVFDLSGEKVFGTESTLTNIHSHYMSPGIDTADGYEYTGRMMITHANSGIGVTVFSNYTIEDAYYRLRREKGNAFHISPHGTSITGGTADTGVIPNAGDWYRFRVQVVNTEIRTEIRAKVWTDDGSDEPGEWQAYCWDDNDTTRLSAGTIGVWSMGPGSKYWDDLAVEIIAAP